MDEFEQSLVKTARVLEKLGIPYTVTGGAAVAMWGNGGGMQDDIDIIIDLAGNQIVPFAHILNEEFEEAMYIQETMLRDAQVNRRTVSIYNPKSGPKIDFFVRTNEPDEQERLTRAVSRTIHGHNVNFISPEDLILTKLMWYKKTGLQKHWDDAVAVASGQKGKLDRHYLEESVKRYDVADLLHTVERGASRKS